MRHISAPGACHIAPAVFLVALVASGFSIYKDYGVPWDEPTQRTYGQVAWDYVLRNDRDLLDYDDRYYGPAYEMLLVGAERFARLKDTREIYYLRHLCGFLLFCLGVWFFYRLCLVRHRDWRVALVGTALLCLSPRIFADSFYNSKDLPFMSVFIIAMYTLFRLLDRPTWKRAAAHAVASAFLIDIRILGVLAPAAAAVGLAHRGLAAAGRHQRLPLLGATSLYLVLTAGLAVAFWPTLWPDPPGQFAAAIRTMARFPWEGQVLYRGSLWEASNLPWHYTLVWIGITTPVVCIAGFLAGLPVVVRSVWRSPARYGADQRFDAVLLAWILVPLGAVLCLKSVVYDAWRHVFFIYPAMLLVGLSGFGAVYRAARCGLAALARGRGLSITAGQKIFTWLPALVLSAILAADLGGVLAFMLQSHPHQNVYFNWLAGGVRGARYRFEMDYWGLSYRQGLEQILTGDPADEVTVFADGAPGKHNLGILPYAARRRLHLAERPEQAKYFIGAYRSRTGPYPYQPERWAVEVDGVSILSVFQMPDRPSIEVQPDRIADSGIRASTAPAVSAAETPMRPAEASHSRWDSRCDSSRDSGPDSGPTQVGAVAAQVYTLLEQYLSNYVTNPDEMTLIVEPLASEEIRKGHVENASVRIKGGQIGDFRHKGIGIPVREVSVSFEDLNLDMQSLAAGKFVLRSLGALKIRRVLLEADSVNAALAASAGKERNLSVEMSDGGLIARWAGRPRAEVRIRLWVAPDYLEPASDNLWFKVEKASVAGVPLPAGLVQWALEGYNPLIKPSKLQATLEAGRIVIDSGRLALGTDSAPLSP